MLSPTFAGCDDRCSFELPQCGHERVTRIRERDFIDSLTLLSFLFCVFSDILGLGSFIGRPMGADDGV